MNQEPTSIRPPVPPDVWEELVKLRDEKAFAKVTLEFHHGTVVLCRIERSIKPKQAA